MIWILIHALYLFFYSQGTCTFKLAHRIQCVLLLYHVFFLIMPNLLLLVYLGYSLWVLIIFSTFFTLKKYHGLDNILHDPFIYVYIHKIQFPSKILFLLIQIIALYLHGTVIIILQIYYF